MQLGHVLPLLLEFPTQYSAPTFAVSLDQPARISLWNTYCWFHSISGEQWTKITFFNWLWWAYQYHRVIYFTFQSNLLSHILCCVWEIILFLIVPSVVLIVSYPSTSVSFAVNRSLINWHSPFWKSIYMWIQTGRKTFNVSDTVLLSFWRPVLAYTNTRWYMPLEIHCNIYLGSSEIHCIFNALWTGDADLCFYITTVRDGWRKSAFLTCALFPRTVHLITQWSCWRMFIEIWPHSELMVCDK